MMVSEAQKAAKRRWDAAHMVKLGVNVRAELADALRAVTAAHGDTVSGVLRAAVLEYMAAHGEPWEPASGPDEEPGEEK